MVRAEIVTQPDVGPGPVPGREPEEEIVQPLPPPGRIGIALFGSSQRASQNLHRLGAGTGTKVTRVHDGFSRAADISDYLFGWPAFLSQLKTDVEGEAK